MSTQKVMQTLGHYAHGQRVRLLSDSAPFRIRLPGGRQRNSGCIWCCCDPLTGEPIDNDVLTLDAFVVRRVLRTDDESSSSSASSSSSRSMVAEGGQTVEFTMEPRRALPVGKKFTFRLRYACPESGVSSSGRDAQYRVTVFYAPS